MSTPAQVVWDAQPAPVQAAAQVAWDEPKKAKRSWFQTLRDYTPEGLIRSKIFEPAAEWAEQKRAEAEEAQIRGAAKGEEPKQLGKYGAIEPLKQFGYGSLRDLLSMGGHTIQPSPKEAAIGAGAVMFPEIAGPLMVGHGVIQAARKAPAALQGDPEAAREALFAGAEAAGGGAMSGAALRTAAPATTTRQIARAANRVLVKGEPPKVMVPEAAQAMRQAIQPGVNIPRAGESIDIAGPRMKQVIQDQGIELRRTGEKGGVTGKTLEVVREAKQSVLAATEQRIGSAGGLQVDASSVADAMERSIPRRIKIQFPEEAASLRARAQTYRDNPMTLREIETTISGDPRSGVVGLNDELRNFYKRQSPTDSNISAELGMVQAEAKALRTLLDQKVEQLSGAGVKDLKREYGALRDVERATARQHAVQTRVKGASLWEGLAYLHAAGDLLSGNALGAARAGATLAVGRMLKNLRDPDFLLEQAFHGPKSFQAAPPIQPAPGPRIAGELPAAPEMMPGPPDTSGPLPVGERTPPRVEWGARMTREAMRRLLPEKASGEPIAPRAEAGVRSATEENALRGEIAKVQQQVRKWSDKMASARDYLAQKRYLENMQAAESKLALLKDAQEKGTPVKVLRGASREELTATWRGLSEEERPRAEALLEEYNSVDPVERSRFVAEHGLNRSEFKGLPFQEKIARVVTGAKTGMSASDFIEAMKAAKKRLAAEGEAQ